MCKYALNTKEKCIINCDTGKIMRPACIDDVMVYHSYLEGTGKEKQAQQLLRDIFKGEKVISKMIARMQGLHFEEK